MKKILLVVTLILTSVAAQAQSSYRFKEYRKVYNPQKKEYHDSPTVVEFNIGGTRKMIIYTVNRPEIEFIRLSDPVKKIDHNGAEFIGFYVRDAGGDKYEVRLFSNLMVLYSESFTLMYFNEDQ